MAEDSQPAPLRRGRPRKSAASAAGSASIRAFLHPRVPPPSHDAEQEPNLSQNVPGGPNETDFDVPGRREKKKGGVVKESPKREIKKESKKTKQNAPMPESPKRETRKDSKKKKRNGVVTTESPKSVRASNRLAENQQRIEDDAAAELIAQIDQIDELRKEVKAAAEEYALLSAGKPVHPFFLKKPVEQQPGVLAEIALNPESLLYPSSPFHVLQSTEIFEAASWSGSVFKIAHRDPASFSFREFADDGLFRLVCTDQRSLQTQSIHDCHGCFRQKNSDVAEDTKISSADQPDSDYFKCTLYRCNLNQNTDTDDISNRLWTDFYQPQSAQEVCGNSDSVAILNDWLRSWKEKSFMKKSDVLASQMRIDDDDQGWFQEDGDTDEDEGDDGLDNTLLLTGPVGCGKSAAVYACANELGFNVIEINASDNRNGAAIKQTVGEASESQTLNWSSLNLENYANNTAPDHKMTMILFEEVDTVFEEDKGFVAALMKLAKTAKRPMILTSNCPQPLVPFTRRISFSKPAVKDLVAHAWMICSSRGIASESPWLMKRMVETHEQDLRKLMMALQFWGQGLTSACSSASTSDSASNAFDHSLRNWISQASESVHSDTQFHLLPQLVSVSFPCSLARTVGGKMASAVEEAEKIAIESLVEKVMARAAFEAQALRASRKQKMLQRKMSLEAEAESLENSDLAPAVGKRKRLKKLKEIHEVKNEEVAGLKERELTDCDAEVSACWSEHLRVNTRGSEDFGAKADLSEVAAGIQHDANKTVKFKRLKKIKDLVQHDVTCSWSEDLAAACGPETGISHGVDKKEGGGVYVTNDLVGKQWRDLKDSGIVCDCSSHASELRVLEAFASTSDGFSACDVISTCCEDLPCSNIPTLLAHRYLQNNSETCCGLMNECDKQPPSSSPSWHEQQSQRTFRQKTLEEEIFLTQPKLSRQCLTVSAFNDYVSLMARIVKLEELQKRDCLRPKHRRSRGYQEDYLAERHVSQPGIDALRELFVFDNNNTHTLTID